MAVIIYAGDAGAFKTCRICGDAKSFGEFSASSTNAGGIATRCKLCVAEYSRGYYKTNKDRVRRQQRRSYYSKDGREKSRARMARWREQNPEKARERSRIDAARERSTPSGRLNSIISAAIGRSLDYRKGGQRWETLVGYTVTELMAHLEKKFLPGMSWQNYGRGGWHIDHIIPKTAFNFETYDHIDFQRCWALENLQPLWAEDNFRKRAKLKKSFQPSLAI